ncbi:MAG: hypothetical protein U0904_06380 [Candidatus Nanopelagicales bacterium]|nr:hypothetical protein [Candidatus Nanopelagicales bacterium]
MAALNAYHGFLSVQRRGILALPPDLRARYHLDDPGAQVELTERADGVIEMRPVVAVPASEVWFWNDKWQQGEREVDEHIRAGRVVVSDSIDDLVADLRAAANNE